jgi:hypothetical protein
MAKQQKSTGAGDGSANEIKRLMDNLYKIVQTTNATAKEHTAVNRELLKVIALLEAGLATNERDALKLVDDISAGLEVTDEFAKRWAKARKATDEDLAKIVKKFREIEKIDNDIIDAADDYNDLLKARFDIIEDEFDLSSKILRNYTDLSKAVAASKSSAMRMGASIADATAQSAKMVQAQMASVGIFDSVTDGFTKAENLIAKVQNDIDTTILNASGRTLNLDVQFSPISGKLDKEIEAIQKSVDLEKSARLDAIAQVFQQNKKLQTQLARQMAAQQLNIGITVDVDTGAILKGSKQLKEGTKEYATVLGQLDAAVGNLSIGQTVLGQFTELVGLMEIGVDLTDQQAQRYAQLTGQLDLATRAMLEQHQLLASDGRAYLDSLQAQKESYNILNMYIGQLSIAERTVERIGHGFDYVNALLPKGIGEFLGISKISETLLESHRKGAQAFANELLKSKNNSLAIKEYMEEFGPALRVALNPMTLLAAGGILLGKLLADTVQKYKDMSREMKISLLQSKKLLEVQYDTLTSQKNQFATMQDIQDVQTELIGSRGKVFSAMRDSTKELAINLSDMGKAFGYGATEATKIHKVFRNIGADDVLATALQGNLGLMSEMAGISPQIIGEDLIESSDIVATYFAGMPEKAARAALETRRMGMSLKDAGAIAQKMLNMDSFMTDMYELQAMTGGGIDFSGAFEKGLMGDIEGMTRDIMDNIGTSAELNRMDYLTRTKIAKTLGMSVEDLSKSVRMREQLADYGEVERTYIEGNLDRMGDVSKMSQDEIRNRLAQLQSTDRLAVAWDKIKGVLLKSLIPLAESFAGAIDAIMPIIDGIIFSFKIVGMLLKPITILVKGMLAPFAFIAEKIGILTGGLDESAAKGGMLYKVAENLSGIFDVVGKAVYWIGAGIGTWFAITKFPTLIGTIVSSLANIIKFVPFIGGAFSSLLGNVGGIFGGLNKKSADSAKTMATPMEGMAATVQTSISAMVEAVKKSIDEMAAHVKSSMGGIQQSLNKGTSVGEIIGAAEKAGKANIDIAKNVEIASAEMSKKVKTDVKTASDAADEATEKIKKKKKDKLVDETAGASAFKVLGEIGAKTFSIMAVRSAMTFFTARKEGEEQMGAMAESINPMFEMALTGLAPMMMGYLTEGIEKTFTKRLEKRIEGNLEEGPKKAKSKIMEIGEAGKTVFGNLKNVAGKVFSGLGNIGAIFAPVDVANQSFDAMAGKAKKLKSVISPTEVVKTEEITKEKSEKTKKEKINFEKVKTEQTIKKTDLEPIKPIELPIVKEGGLFAKLKEIQQKLKGQKLEVPQTPIDVNPEVKSKGLMDKIKGLKDKLFGQKLQLPQNPLEINPEVKSKGLMGKLKDLKTKLFGQKFEIPQAPIELPTLNGEKGLDEKVKSVTGKLRKSKFEIPQKSIPVPQVDKKSESMLSKGLTFIKDFVLSSYFGIEQETVEPPQLNSEPLQGQVQETQKKLSKKKFKLDQTPLETPQIDPKGPSKITKVLDGVKNFASGAFDTVVDLLKKAWTGLKSILGDVVSLISDSLAKVGQALGQTIKSVLTGIGEGLNVFKTDAVKGAAALVLVSGALWISSKAFQNFADVPWEAVAKGTVALGGLTIAAVALGKISGQVLIGSAAIAILGASLYPAAIALEKFNNVEWSGLAKAGTALVGLGIAASVLSGMAPAMLIGAAGIAAVGLALNPLADAMVKFQSIEWKTLAVAGAAIVGFGATAAIFGTISPLILAGSVAIGAASAGIYLFSGALGALNVVIGTIDPSPIAEISKPLFDLVNISAVDLFALAGGIAAIGASVAALQIGAGVGSVVNNLFGGTDVISSQLAKLAELADPLQKVAEALRTITGSLTDLNAEGANIPTAKLDEIRNIERSTGLEAKVNERIAPIAQRMQRDNAQRVDNKTELNPFKVQATSTTPPKSMVAQNVAIEPPKRESVAQNIQMQTVAQKASQSQTSQSKNNQNENIYKQTQDADMVSDLQPIQMLMQQMVQLLDSINRKNTVVELDGVPISKAIRKINNNT